MRDKERKKGRV